MLRPEGAGGSWEANAVARVAAGDDAALAEIYDQYAGSVYGLALRVVRDRAAAEDITQDVFVWFWEHPDRFQPERGSLRSWLNVVTHRRAVDRIRREGAARRRDANDEASATTSPPDIAEVATSLVLADRVRQAVDVLPPDQRVAIELAYFAGKTYREVAQHLGIPEGTAKSRLRLGLGKLAGALREEDITQWT